MKTKKKSLQRLTRTQSKIDTLLDARKVTPEDVEGLNVEEVNYLNEVLTKKCNELKGIERDRLFQKIELILTEDTKNQMWEFNHSQITWAIATFMQEQGRMPTQTFLAEKTGISRQTINKHLKEYSFHPLYLDQVEQFRFMAAKVLAKVFYFAVNGDVKAARLYLEAVGRINVRTVNNSLIQQQNNFIQINGTVLSQESIQHLNKEQLNQIESIIKTASL
jgi:hypothetical protein